MTKGLTVFALAFGLAACNGSAIVQNARFAGNRDHFDGAALTYWLPMATVNLVATFTAKEGSLTFAPDPVKITPDPDARIDLNYLHAGLSNDDVDIAWDGLLLKSVSTNPTDQTVQLVKNVEDVLTATTGLRKDIAAGANNLAMLTNRNAGTPAPPDTFPIDACHDDIKVMMSINLTLEKVGRAFSTQPSVKSGCTISIEVIEVDASKGMTSVGFGRVGDKTTIDECAKDAICFRAAKLFTIYARATLRGPGGRAVQVVRFDRTGALILGQDKQPLKGPFTVALQQDQPISAPVNDTYGYVHFNRRAFVQNKTSITFTNGILSEFKSTDPSEIVGFFALPTEILKAATLTIPLTRPLVN